MRVHAFVIELSDYGVDRGCEIVGALGRVVCQVMPFGVAPAPFDGVQLRGVVLCPIRE